MGNKISLPAHSLEIRPIQPGDLDAVLAVYRQCEDFLALGPAPTASREMVLADIAISHREGGVFCGIYATTSGKMIGVIDYVPHNYKGEPHVAFLELLMIAAPFRSQGVGKAVVEAIELEIKKDALVRKILSGVQVNNPQAVQFWLRNGYRIVSGPELLPDQTTVFGLCKDFDQLA
jgi:ribosomal protein S18 acetylase RimI-like enzyme